MDLRIGIMDIFKFLDGNSNSRCIEEGEKILKAHHLITCGIKNMDDTTVELLGLCLQTSALSAPPHEINCHLIIETDDLKINKLLCSCKAGSTGRCKHCSAILIHCSR